MFLPNLPALLAAMEDLKETGLIRDYAVAGSIALAFWDEAVNTDDLDILVLHEPNDVVVLDMTPFYEWADARGYEREKEHFKIAGINVQLMPTAANSLEDEAIRTARTLESDGLSVRVVAPEYLIAMWLSPGAKTYTRKERAARLRQSGQVDQALLADLLARYHLSW
jgi:hypothetical protein